MGCAQGKQSREDTGGGVEEKRRHRRSRRPVITLKEKKLQKHLLKKISTYAKCRERLGAVGETGNICICIEEIVHRESSYSEIPVPRLQQGRHHSFSCLGTQKNSLACWRPGPYGAISKQGCLHGAGPEARRFTLKCTWPGTISS